MNKELMQGITQYRVCQVLLRVVFDLAVNGAFNCVAVEVLKARNYNAFAQARVQDSGKRCFALVKIAPN